VGLTNLGSESETCVGRRVRLVGVFISFEKNFYRLPFTPPSLVRRIGPSLITEERSSIDHRDTPGPHRGCSFLRRKGRCLVLFEILS
jgi:hypothetical protein